MIEISTNAFLVFLALSGLFVVFSLWFLEKLISDFMEEIRQLRDVADAFAEACELDGFGHVRDAHYGDLNKAMREYKEINNA